MQYTVLRSFTCYGHCWKKVGQKTIEVLSNPSCRSLLRRVPGNRQPLCRRPYIVNFRRFRRHFRVNMRLTVWLTAWLTVWLTDWLTGWLTVWLTDWLSDCLTDWLTVCLPACLPACLTVWLSNWLTDWLTVWLSDWLTEWLTDWLTERKSFTFDYLSLHCGPDRPGTTSASWLQHVPYFSIPFLRS